jgi:hypothetical protein
MNTSLKFSLRLSDNLDTTQCDVRLAQFDAERAVSNLHRLASMTRRGESPKLPGVESVNDRLSFDSDVDGRVPKSAVDKAGKMQNNIVPTVWDGDKITRQLRTPCAEELVIRGALDVDAGKHLLRAAEPPAGSPSTLRAMISPDPVFF